MSQIVLEDLSKSFGQARAVDSVSLEIRAGEFFSILGPSGSGKSTILRLIAGFTEPSGGRIEVAGESMAGIPPERRDMGYVFQDYALFPHLSVYQNIEFGLRARGMAAPERDAAVREGLALCGLSGYGDRRPTQLSGGERQRVAIARALVVRPRVLLLDEPLGALDRLLREEMQFEIKRLQHEIGITTIQVTHDQTEALTMSDRIAVVNRGRVCEVGTGRELYEWPRSMFTARFMGTNNLIHGVIESQVPGGYRVRVGGDLLEVRNGGQYTTGSNVALAVRPENVSMMRADAESGQGSAIGRVVDEVFRGPVIRYDIVLNGGTALAVDVPARDATFSVGDSVGIDLATGETSMLLPDEGDDADE